MINESKKAVKFPVMKITQPIGEFYVGKISAEDLIDISWFDVRRIGSSNELDNYLGIQRKVIPSRVSEIARYVRLPDAAFPTAVVLAVEGKTVELNSICKEAGLDTFFEMTLKNKPGDFSDSETILFRGIARVLDGQHRIMGLHESDIDKTKFFVNVCVFVDADIADQAGIFGTVNLAQTKVNRSLVYDLLSYNNTRSPEKTCHTVTVLLDKKEKSPFYGRIKRLGVATEGRFGEVLTQATIVKALLPYISDDVLRDRHISKTSGFWSGVSSYDSDRLIFRKWFIDENDGIISDQLMHYFEAVRQRWPQQWDNPTPGNILVRTNGFRAFMRLLRPLYNEIKSGEGDFVKMSSFKNFFDKVKIDGKDINSSNYIPGSGGENSFYRDLLAGVGLADYS